MLTSYRLEKPTLDWQDDGIPRSSQFDDVYFDKESGLEETRYVFLQHNQLTERWNTLSDHCFVIAETGFGTGLNFLCAWQEFLKAAPDNAQLHFISVEKYPLTREMLHDALHIWPSLAEYSQQLISAYPEVCHGFHRIELEQGRVQLTLWFGEAEEGFASLNADVDAWFLDGFAPSKNPEMWTDKLFHHIHRLSHIGTSFATFTAAGIVRRGLQKVGFEVNKVKGFGHKREMAIGKLKVTSLSFPERMAQGEAWFNVRHPASVPVSQVLVVGSGLAGANTAYALAKQGVKVTVWEKGDHIACAASGNPQGMLYPKLTAQDTHINRFYLAGFLYATRFFKTLSSDQVFWQQCGLTQIPKHEKEQARFQKLLNQQLYPESVLQTSSERAGSLYLPLSGWVAPQILCQALLSHPNINVQLNTPLDTFEKVSPSSNSGHHWKAISQSQEHVFSHIVLCSANDTEALTLPCKTPTSAIRGQVSQMPLKQAKEVCHSKSESQDKLQINSVLCEFGYVSPPLDDTIHFGSTYDLKDTDTHVREEGHQRNLTILERVLGVTEHTFTPNDCQGRVSFRCAVNDYAPIVGPVLSDSNHQQAYNHLGKNAKWKSNEIKNPVTGLYINIGHGSRGLISTPLSGQYIASLITNTPSPLEQEISHALHPSRFVVRALKRNTEPS